TPAPFLPCFFASHAASPVPLQSSSLHAALPIWTVATGPGLAVMAVAIAVALPFCLSLPRNARRSGQASRAAAASMPALVRRTGMVPSIFAALIVVTGFDLITAYMPGVAESVGLS